MRRWFAGLCALVGFVALASGAMAQSVPGVNFAPPRTSIDERGVDLVGGNFFYSEPAAAIGTPGAGGLSGGFIGPDRIDPYSGTIKLVSGKLIVAHGTTTEVFTLPGGTPTSGTTYNSDLGTGSTLTYTFHAGSGTHQSNSEYDLRTTAGVKYIYFANLGDDGSLTPGQVLARLFSYHERSTGASVGITYREYPQCQVASCPGTANWKNYYHIEMVRNNYGYELLYAYDITDSYSFPATGPTGYYIYDQSTPYYNATKFNQYFAPIKQVATSEKVAATCSPSAGNPAYNCITALPSGKNWPTITYSGANITDTALRITAYSISTAASSTSTITPQLGSAITVVRDGNGRVYTWSNGTGTWTYTYADNTPSSNIRTTTVTDPNGHTRILTSDMTTLQVLSDTDGASRTTTYSYYTSTGSGAFAGALDTVTYPEGNATKYQYDGRGNVTSVTQKAKPGSGLSDLTTSTTYGASCTSADDLVCNQPQTTTDAAGNVTTYVYDSSNPTTNINYARLLSVTHPSVGGVAPQERYTYDYFKDAFGNPSAPHGSPSISMLVGISVCNTGSYSTTWPTVGHCVVGGVTTDADETVTTIAYKPSGDANEFEIGKVTVKAGDNSVSRSQAMTYDAVGNLTSIDGPLTTADGLAADSDDTTKYRYDADRELVGKVEPDPDGAGSLLLRATRQTYDNNGRVTLTEVGTVNSQSDADWAAFSPLQSQATAYDSASRPITTSLAAGGTTYAVSQTAYDNANLVTYTAQRMNSADFASPPSASTQGTGGADRITHQTYTAADEPYVTTDGYGTALARNLVTNVYTSNGKVQTQTDANGNVTRHTYDGFDRPDTNTYAYGTGLASSESATYKGPSVNGAGQVNQITRRDSSTFSPTYDALGRQTNLANGATLTYDNVDRALAVSLGGVTLTNSYDALGQLVSAAQPVGTVTYQYDTAGRRKRMDYPTVGASSLYVTYSYDLADEVTAIKQNGSTTLAAYAYDNLGGRASKTLGSGASGPGSTTSYTYDPISQLSALSLDLPSTGLDQTLGFTRNVAGQITQRTTTNNAYAPSVTTATTSYTPDALNRVSALSYNNNGGLTNDGVQSFDYNGLGQLVCVNGSGACNTGPAVSLTYDPAGRLAKFTSPVTGGHQFLYDGQDMIAEYDGSGALLDRYVHGPGTDEPVVWFSNAGAGQTYYLTQDERGSVAAITDSTSASTANSYDEYGTPGVNTGRFQYTGQAWISEIGLYYYKARFYSPSLGRFMTPDPAGYGGGDMNLYAYVGNDPINMTDPSGLCDQDGTWKDGDPEPCPSLVSPLNIIGETIYCPAGYNPGWMNGVQVCFRISNGPSVNERPPTTGQGGASGGSSAKQGSISMPKVAQCPAVNPGSAGSNSEIGVALDHPGWQTGIALFTALTSLSETAKDFPIQERHNGAGDAWRHFRWNFAMTQSMRPDIAAEFADAHEVSHPGPAAEVAMDLYNNAMGRAFGSDPAYKGLSPNQAAYLALRSGCLNVMRLPQ